MSNSKILYLILLILGNYITIFHVLPILIFLCISIILSPVALILGWLNWKVLKMLWIRFENS